MNQISTSCLILPAATSKNLNYTSDKTLQLIFDLAKRQGRQNKSGRVYCMPSQGWIAARIGRSRKQVNRAVQQLKRLKLIEVIRRRKVEGHWQTCLYKLGKSLLSFFSSLNKKKTNNIHRETFASHLVPLRVNKDTKGCAPRDTFFINLLKKYAPDDKLAHIDSLKAEK